MDNLNLIKIIICVREKIMELKIENNKTEEQSILLTNRNTLSVSGTNKIVSLKSDIIQLETILGGLIVNGEKLELLKLDNSTSIAEISGKINGLKFVEVKHKEPLLRKLFK